MNVGMRDWIFRLYMRRIASSALCLELQTLAFYAHRLMNSPVQFSSNASLGAQMAGWVIFMVNSQVQEWKKLLPKVSISFKPCHYTDIWTADTWVYSVTSFISLAQIHNSKKFCFVSTIFSPLPVWLSVMQWYWIGGVHFRTSLPLIWNPEQDYHNMPFFHSIEVL